jgi:hypothetical protein
MKILLNNQLLILKDVKRDKLGNIKSGRVLNGQWDLEIRDKEILAKAIPGYDDYVVQVSGNDPERIVSRFPFVSLEELKE